jgi:hypothetical protein
MGGMGGISGRRLSGGFSGHDVDYFAMRTMI